MTDHLPLHTPVPLKRILPDADNTGLLDSKGYAESMSGLFHWKERLILSEGTGVGFAAPGGDFTRAILQHFCLHRELSSITRIRGATVVELGAGMSACGYELAAMLGAAAYIAIEAFYADCIALSIAQQSLHYDLQHRIPYCILAEDILSALLRIPDSSVSVFAFGIESCILGGAHYQKKVQAELSRVLSSGGGFLSLRSDIVPPTERIHPFKVNRKGFIEQAISAIAPE